MTPRWRPVADADQYVQLSRSLADGTGFGFVFPQSFHHPTAFRPPLLPALLTPGAWLFGNALWPDRLLVALIGSAVVVLAGVLAARLAGRTAGWVAAAAVAVYPPLLANDTITLTEPLALLLVLAAVLLLDEDRWIAAGVATALLLVTRPNGYLVVLVLGAWCWRRIGWQRAAGFAAVSAALLVPWMIRNQVQVHTFRPTTSDGFTMEAIYGTPAQGANTFVDPVYSPGFDTPYWRLAAYDEALWNRELQHAALHDLKGHPAYVWQVVRRNFRSYFEISPHLNRYPERNDGRLKAFRDATLPIFYPVSILGLVGLFWSWRDLRVRVIVAVVTQFVLLSLVLVAPPRLRAPFDLACCIGLGLLVARIVERRRTDPTGEDEAVDPGAVPAG